VFGAEGLAAHTIDILDHRPGAHRSVGVPGQLLPLDSVTDVGLAVETEAVDHLLRIGATLARDQGGPRRSAAAPHSGVCLRVQIGADPSDEFIGPVLVRELFEVRCGAVVAVGRQSLDGSPSGAIVFECYAHHSVIQGHRIEGRFPDMVAVAVRIPGARRNRDER